MTAIGLVINPKHNVPVLCTWGSLGSRSNVKLRIWSLKEAWLLGAGYYETYDFPAQETDFPRSHIPYGVSPKREGYGTCLYTGMCLGAHQQSQGELSPSMNQDLGDGISSESEGRSSAADTWWDSANRRGLTGKEDVEKRTSDVEIDGADLSCDFGEDIEIESAFGDIIEEVEVDIYPYDNTGDLVLTSFSVPNWQPNWANRLEREFDTNDYKSYLRELWRELRDGDNSDLFEANNKALAACDVSELFPQAVNLLVTVLRKNEAEEELIRALRVRANLGVDARQLRLPFEPNVSREVANAVGIAKELRQELDWSRFKSLP